MGSLENKMNFARVQEIENHISSSSCIHPPLKSIVYHGNLEGSTPLIQACHYGELDVVKHIVECWGVDVRAAATYYLEGPGPEWKIDSATPLFVASFSGHSKIVRYLLEKGAPVNVRTACTTDPNYDGLYPLYGAVCNNWMSQHRKRQSSREKHAESSAIVHSLLEFGADVASASFRPSDGFPIWREQFCGVDAAAALINHGLDLAMRSPYRGQTVLHYYASHKVITCITEEDSLTIIKLLLSKGADAHAKDEWGFSVILLVASQILLDRPGYNMTILEYLLERDEISREEKIEALELAGALLLSGVWMLQPSQPSKAFDVWRRALRLRQIETEGIGPIIKTPLVQLRGVKKEWITLAELEDISSSPSQYEIQSLLVKLRIFSSKSWIAVESLLIRCFDRKYSLEPLLLVKDRRDLVLNILWAMLGSIRLFDPHELELWDWTVKITKCLITNLIIYPEIHGPWINEAIVIETSIRLIVATDQYHLEDRGYSDEHGMKIPYGYDVAELIASLEVKDVKVLQWLFQLMRRDKPEQFGSFMLHEACRNCYSTHYLATIRLLLDAGADPNAVERPPCMRWPMDPSGNTPLHVVAALPQNCRELMDAAARMLLDAGAHLDSVNRSGMTAADIWIKRNEMGNNQDEDARWNARPDWCRTARSLSYLAGRVIRSHKIHYADGGIPSTLIPFLDVLYQ